MPAADAVGLTASMYGAIETGFRTADPEQRQRLAALYGVTVEKFQAAHPRHTHSVAPPHRP